MFPLFLWSLETQTIQDDHHECVILLEHLTTAVFTAVFTKKVLFKKFRQYFKICILTISLNLNMRILITLKVRFLLLLLFYEIDSLLILPIAFDFCTDVFK